MTAVPVYVNTANVNLNEVAYLEFGVNSQGFHGPVVRITMLYDTLKMIHEMLSEAIKQHDMKLHELKRTKDNMN